MGFSEERLLSASLRMCGRNVSVGPEHVGMVQTRKGYEQGMPESVCVCVGGNIGTGRREGGRPRSLAP